MMVAFSLAACTVLAYIWTPQIQPTCHQTDREICQTVILLIEVCYPEHFCYHIQNGHIPLKSTY